MTLKRTVRALWQVYRGLSGMVLPQQFWETNEFGVKGGVESAFMSTTRDKGVAVAYANSQRAKGGPGFIFEIQQGMVDRGSDLSWLSQYPHEQEILFAPLTGLEVQSTRVENSLIVIVVRLSINLKSVPIEDVVSKMQTSHVAMATTMKHDLENAEASTDVSELQKILDRAEVRGHEYFNSADLYQKATEEATKAQLACLNLLSEEATWVRAAAETRTRTNSVASKVTEEKGEAEAAVSPTANETLAARMQTVAQLLARNNLHSKAAEVLTLRFKLCGLTLESGGEKALDQAHAQYKGQRIDEDALKALISLLESGQSQHQPWPMTVRKLVELTGDEKAGFHVACAGLALKVPIAILRHRLFEMDATPKACKGSEVLHAANEGDIEGIARALRNKKAKALATTHEHVLKLCPTASAVCDICGDSCGKKSWKCQSDECDFDACSNCHGHPTIVDCCEENQVTPLMLAARNSSPEAVEVLLKNGAKPNRRSRRLCSALSIAAEHPNEKGLQVVNLLLKHNADVELMLPDREGLTPMLTAVWFGSCTDYTSIVQAMLTALSAKEGGERLIIKCLNRGEEGEKNPGTTALMRACQVGANNMAKLLLDSKADANKLSGTDRSALFFAAQSRASNADMIKLLCKRGADPNHGGSPHSSPLVEPLRDAASLTPSDDAIAKVRALLEAKARITDAIFVEATLPALQGNATDDQLERVLDLAQLLLEFKPAPSTDVFKRHVADMTRGMQRLNFEHPQTKKLFELIGVEQKTASRAGEGSIADGIPLADPEGDAGLYYGQTNSAGQPHGLGCLKYDDGQAFYGECQDGQMWEGRLGPTSHVMYEGKWDLSPSAAIDTSATAKYEEAKAAATAKYEEAQAAAAEAAAATGNYAQRKREAALLQAASSGDCEVVRSELEKGTRKDCKNSSGKTPLWLACFAGHSDVVKALLLRGAALELADDRNTTPLCAATYKKQHVCLEIMINAKADPHTADVDHDTPLHNACYSGSVECADLLIKAGAVVCAQNRRGARCLTQPTMHPLVNPLISGSQLWQVSFRWTWPRWSVAADHTGDSLILSVRVLHRTKIHGLISRRRSKGSGLTLIPGQD